MTSVELVVVDGIDDPARPTGGNVYHRRLRDGLVAAGWDVRLHALAGNWPVPEPAAMAELRSILAAMPDGAAILIDGLIASAVPALLQPHARRLRIVVMMHMPLGLASPAGHLPAARRGEGAALAATHAVVTTSRWTRDRLLELYPLGPRRVFVVPPGVDAAGLAPGSRDGSRLLCVGTVAAHKGQDVLLTALSQLPDQHWRCDCVGMLDCEPDFVRKLMAQSAASGIEDRLSLLGPRVGAELDRLYDRADVLVVASRFEAYGMVISEALARGIPVIASSVGGIPEAMGLTRAGGRPGLLVPAQDPAALSAALRRWLSDGRLRASLRGLARQVRPTLARWEETAAVMAQVLTEIGSHPVEPVRSRGRMSVGQR
ncbi:glycosyltransferase involved in cell wall bisynthesis [Jatrophihabitans sp. GAS493]|uniref:glycosyltransferase family 4 protein n=1 Tax=Jatrophihabitans sp. GAS493 TaxID=1907575 RepID=UPI000BB69B8F|nr:glycosyltransferase family 4 protein [Jatrophihabitans sp. GAS493]SOD74915.1 glycosyltransferase involved in cell wall bisynthesis [Jatrophihabitans sp. GAS493]